MQHLASFQFDVQIKWTVFHTTIYFTLNIQSRFTALFMRLMTAGKKHRWARSIAKIEIMHARKLSHFSSEVFACISIKTKAIKAQFVGTVNVHGVRLQLPPLLSWNWVAVSRKWMDWNSSSVAHINLCMHIDFGPISTTRQNTRTFFLGGGVGWGIKYVGDRNTVIYSTNAQKINIS